jgi:hypothetical protein
VDRNLITNLIRQKLLNEQYYLVEDRLPALMKKYSGSKEIISKMPHPMAIAMGYKPTTRTVPILSTQHDLIADRNLRGMNETDRSQKIIQQVHDADPTPNKEYADRMLHWYARSSEYSHQEIFPDLDERTIKYTMDPVPSQEQQQKGNLIHAQHRERGNKLRNEMHSQVHPFRLEDLGRAKEAIELHKKVKHLLPAEHKDINKINSLAHLEKIVQPHRDYASGSEIEQQAKSGASVIHEDDDIKVYHVKTEEASKTLGKGTRWCVSGDEYCAFNNYNETSPMIMFVDKKQKMNQHLSGNTRGEKRNYKRYMFHFGEIRHPGENEFDAQFMDEADDPVEYHKFASTFPQTKHIPALQHLHSSLFQSASTQERAEKLEKDPNEVQNIVSHFKKHSEMQRPSVGNEQYATKQAYNHLIHLSSRGNEHGVHPVATHFFGDQNTQAKSTPEESKQFLSTLLDNFYSMEGGKAQARKVLLKPQQVNNIFNKNMLETPRHANTLAHFTDNAESHERAYHFIKQNRHKLELSPIDDQPKAFTFLGKTQNRKLIQTAFDDVKKGVFGNYNADTGGQFLPNHEIYSSIAKNLYTPDHVLQELIQKSPLHGANSDESDIDPDNGTLIHSRKLKYDTTGQEALRTMIRKMERRGGM